MANLPTGTVTFLFSDIEGSTKLWQQHPDAMKAALARHNEILHKSIADHDGYVFKTVGDEFCAAFDTAPEALAAALAIQRTLHTEDWSVGAGLSRPAGIKVRMALHTGTAELRDGDYFGVTLSRVAYLMAAGHGDQTLLSAATQELVRDHLPEDVTLQALGKHRLRDLEHAEQIFKLVAADLPVDFPPLRTLEDYRHNLPLQLTSFIGREKEMADVKRLLGKSRLVTLTGVGGTGKTRLALQVAADLLNAFPDGVWLVGLAPLADPALVPLAVASALGVREQPGASLEQTLAAYLQARRLLLLLDNCEHLLAACARLAEDMLQTCPQLHILASSREAMRVAGEAPYHVPSLALPDLRHLPPIETLSQYEAVRLFTERAVTVQPAFAVTNANAPAVAQVCQRLDGIPLAIELVAARVRAMPVEQISKRLDDRFRLLTGGSRTALPRQQTLQASIDWSYSLLSDPERMLLRRLSVFAGGWSLEAAEQVCADVAQDAGHPRDAEHPQDVVLSSEILDLLIHLVDKSLVVAEEQEGEARYHMLETIRQHARDRLLESGEGEALRHNHLAYFLRVAEEANNKVRGPEQEGALRRMEMEHDNLRSALQWSLGPASPSHLPEAGLRLAGALGFFWGYKSLHQEGWNWIAAVLSHPESQGRTPARAKALHQASFLAPDYATKRILLVESIAICREVGDKGNLAWALGGLGFWVEFQQHHLQEASQMITEALALSREVGDENLLANCLLSQGEMAMALGDVASARILYDESLALFQKLGDYTLAAIALSHRAYVDVQLGDYPAAHARMQQRLTIMQEQGNMLFTMASLQMLGFVTLLEGHVSEAAALYQEGLALAQEVGNNQYACIYRIGLGEVARLQGDLRQAQAVFAASLPTAVKQESLTAIAHGLRNVACIAVAVGDAARAVRLSAAAERHGIQGMGLMHQPAGFAQDLAAARAQVGAAAFEAAWAQGQAMSLEEAIALAVEEFPTQVLPSAAVMRHPPQGSQPAKSQPLVEPLSGREMEVLRLMAEGLSNSEIAEKLHVTVGTVKTHANAIFGKLEARNRTLAVGRARTLKLID